MNYFTEEKERELLELKQKWGWSDPRNTEEYKNCDICANDIFRDSWQSAGVERKAFPAPPPMGPNAAKAASGASGVDGSGSARADDYGARDGRAGETVDDVAVHERANALSTNRRCTALHYDPDY